MATRGLCHLNVNNDHLGPKAADSFITLCSLVVEQCCFFLMLRYNGANTLLSPLTCVAMTRFDPTLFCCRLVQSFFEAEMGLVQMGDFIPGGVREFSKV